MIEIPSLHSQFGSWSWSDYDQKNIHVLILDEPELNA